MVTVWLLRSRFLPYPDFWHLCLPVPAGSQCCIIFPARCSFSTGRDGCVYMVNNDFIWLPIKTMTLWREILLRGVGQITIIIAANYPTSLLLSRNSIPLVKNAANKLNVCGFPDHCPYFINKRHTFAIKALSVLFYDFRTFWLAFKEAHNLPT